MASISVQRVLKFRHVEGRLSNRIELKIDLYIPHMGGCQNYGPFLGTLNIRCHIKIGIQKRDHNFDNHMGFFRVKGPAHERDCILARVIRGAPVVDGSESRVIHMDI